MKAKWLHALIVRMDKADKVIRSEWKTSRRTPYCSASPRVKKKLRDIIFNRKYEVSK